MRSSTLRGLYVTAFATGFVRPRVMRTAPNGDLFIGDIGSYKPGGVGVGVNPNTGRILVMRAGAAPATPAEVVLDGLDRPSAWHSIRPDRTRVTCTSA